MVKKLLKIIGMLMVMMIGIIIIYSLIFCNPQFLFKYKVEEKNLYLFSDEPISSNATNILRDVQERLSKSQLYNSRKAYGIFICNNISRFKFFALGTGLQAGGFNKVYLSSKNVFISKSNIENNHIFNSYGIEVGEQRTLSYVIAHEIAHLIAGKKAGGFNYLRLPTWITEGYSEYIAQKEFNYDETLDKLKKGMLEESPEFKPYYYDKYHLLVSYLLDVKKVSTDDLLEGKYMKSDVEKELKNTTKN